jgi:hypothetical protein
MFSRRRGKVGTKKIVKKDKTRTKTKARVKMAPRHRTVAEIMRLASEPTAEEKAALVAPLPPPIETAAPGAFTRVQV